MCAIITNNLPPDVSDTSLILDHDIDDLSLIRINANPQAVITVTADSLYEFFTFQIINSAGFIVSRELRAESIEHRAEGSVEPKKQCCA